MKLNNISKNQLGTSLLELVVAIGLFAIIMLAAVSIFQIVVESQKNAIAAQNVQESIRYVFESASKEIRMAVKSESGCVSDLGLGSLSPSSNRVYNLADSGKVLFFKNEDGDCVKYYVNNETLMVAKHDGATLYSASTTPASVKVKSIRFRVLDNAIGTVPGDFVQPMVTINSEVESSDIKEVNRQSMIIQTAVSARNYEY